MDEPSLHIGDQWDRSLPSPYEASLRIKAACEPMETFGGGAVGIDGIDF
jgi:hypothetical protein